MWDQGSGEVLLVLLKVPCTWEALSVHLIPGSEVCVDCLGGT